VSGFAGSDALSGARGAAAALSQQFPSSVAGDVRLAVGGQVHAGWLGMRLAHSIESACAKFTIDCTERWTASERPLARQVRAGQPCTLTLDGEEVLTGHIDGVDVRYDAREHSLSAIGRDQVADAVDGAATVDPPFEYRDLGLEELARRLCAPFGVEVRRETDCGAPFARAAIQPGETAWEAIERACRQRGVLAASDGRRTLRLTRAGAGGPAAGALRLGGPDGNILRAQGRFDWAARHDPVVVRGSAETPGGGQAEGRCRDEELGRYRPKVLIAEAAGPGGSFQRRAEWEVLFAAARSRRLTYTVPGWRGASGRLWQPNTLVRVEDAFLGLAQELLIVSVLRILGPEGTLTEIELAPKDAFEVLPQPEKPAGRGGGPGLRPGLYRGEEGARNEGGGAGFRREGDLPRAPGASRPEGGR
jgi:prophage tail gpP-like protein